MAESYTLVSQVPDQEISPSGGNFESGWLLTYKITSGPATGTSGRLFVTNEQHNAATVGPMIAAKVADATEIAKLGMG